MLYIYVFNEMNENVNKYSDVIAIAQIFQFENIQNHRKI